MANSPLDKASLPHNSKLKPRLCFWLLLGVLLIALCAFAAGYVARRWGTLAPYCTLVGHTDAVLCVCFTGRGERVVSGSADHSVRVWDARSGKLLYTLLGHTDEVTSVVACADNKSVISGSLDATFRIWDTEKGVCVASRHTKAGPVIALALSPSGRLLVLAGKGGNAELWRLPGLSACDRLVQLDLQSHPSGLAFTRDGKSIFSGEYWLARWHVAGCTLRQEFMVSTDSIILALATSPDGRIVATGDTHWSIHIWNAYTGKEESEIHVMEVPVATLAYSPSGQFLAAAGGLGAGPIILIDTQSARPVLKLRGPAKGTSGLAFSPDGSLLAAADWAGMIHLWSIPSKNRAQGTVYGR